MPGSDPQAPRYRCDGQCQHPQKPSHSEAIENARAALRYLPQYSPDLNPIEMAFSQFRAFLRKAAERTVPGLRRAIRAFLPRLSAQECANYFRRAGYAAI